MAKEIIYGEEARKALQSGNPRDIFAALNFLGIPFHNLYRFGNRALN